MIKSDTYDMSIQLECWKCRATITVSSATPNLRIRILRSTIMPKGYLYEFECTKCGATNSVETEKKL